MKNQRRGPDFVIKVIGWISTLSWIILITVFMILMVLNPSLRGVTLTYIPARQISSGWMAFLYFMFVLLIIINISGIVFNMLRMKRKTDRMKKTFFISIFASIIGIILMSLR
jgi:hypothetical protein